MRFIIGILSGAYLAWTVFGSLQIRFSPVYVAIQPANECGPGGSFAWQGPESTWNMSVELE